MTKCRRCSKPLKTLLSIEIGYGPVCHRKHRDAEAYFLKHQMTIDDLQNEPVNAATFQNSKYEARIQRMDGSFLVAVHSGAGLTKLEAYEEYNNFQSALNYVNENYIEIKEGVLV